MSKKFIKTNDGHIYKRTSNAEVYLKVSPYEIGEDRRINSNVLFQMIKDGNASIINKNKALEEINTLWGEYGREWVFNGKQYKIKKNESYKIGSAKKHIFQRSYVNRNGERIYYPITYYLGVFHGKLCWFEYSQYYPQMEVYEFENLDNEPYNFMQWTNIKNIKHLYEKNYEGKWVVI